MPGPAGAYVDTTFTIYNMPYLNFSKTEPECTFSQDKQTCDLNHGRSLASIVGWQMLVQPKQSSLEEMSPLQSKELSLLSLFMQPRQELAHPVPTMAL